jgi:hypothetical protein
MYVKIADTQTEYLVSVEEADDCTRLHVEAGGLTDDEVWRALQRSALGHSAEPGQAWLEIYELRVRARERTEKPGWEADFDAMVSYAGGKGWLDETGELVAAHIARPDPGSSSPDRTSPAGSNP